MLSFKAPQPNRKTLRNPTQKKIGYNSDKKPSLRVPFLLREKAAYLILRRAGLSINLISKAFGRSSSVVHRALKKAERFGHNLDVWCRRLDMRKLPYQARMRMATFRRFKMFTLLSKWEAWICGEEDEPP